MHTNERVHSLDVVRAFALLAGIVLHSTMSFMPGLASAGFPADRSLSSALQVVFYVIHVFRMALFFFLAGYFAHLAFHRKGMAAFLRDRAKRIVVPLLGGWLLFGPVAMVLVYVAFGPPVGATPPPRAGGVPLGHLWFLYYLLWFYAAMMVARTTVDAIGNGVVLRARLDRWLSKLVQGWAGLLVLAALMALCLFVTPGWVLWTGIASPDTGLMPQWPATPILGTMFAFGWMMHRQSDVLTIWRRRWASHLGAAVAFTTVSFWLVEHASDPVAVAAPVKAAYAASYALAITTWVCGLVGAAQRFCGRESGVGRYVADSSYWLYLAHLPVVFALQLIVRDWPLHWTLKFPAIVVAAVTLLLVSYHVMVRPTWIGQVLNGRKFPRGRPLGRARASSRLDSGSANPICPTTIACGADDGAAARNSRWAPRATLPPRQRRPTRAWGQPSVRCYRRRGQIMCRSWSSERAAREDRLAAALRRSRSD